MKGWLIYTKQDALENQAYIDWFIKEGKKQQVHISLILREEMSVGIQDGKQVIYIHNKKISLPQFAVIRTIEPLLQYVFTRHGIKTFNSYDIAQLTNHKSFTYLKINELNIPTIPTFFTTRDALPSHPPLSYPFVIKSATGRGGKGVYFIEKEDDWNKLSKTNLDKDVVIQSANVQLGRDLRVFVIGKRIIAAILRKNDDDFRANYTLGGSAQPYELTKKQRYIVQRLIDHFNFGLVGIDFFLTKKNDLIFNEIEDVVGSRTLSKTTNINLLELYVRHIKNTILKNEGFFQ